MKKIILLSILVFFIGCSSTPPEEKRRYALQGTGEYSGNIPVLIKALKEDPYDLCRAQAAIELGRPSLKEAVQPLIEALKDKSPLVRADAAESLGKIGESSASEALIDILKKDSDITVRCRTAISLGKLGSKDAILPLIDLLGIDEFEKKEEYKLKSAAHKALKSITGFDIEPDKAKWKEQLSLPPEQQPEKK